MLNFTAFAEQGDVLGREVGAALWPERYPVEAGKVYLVISTVVSSVASEMKAMSPADDAGRADYPVCGVYAVTPDDVLPLALHRLVGSACCATAAPAPVPVPTLASRARRTARHDGTPPLLLMATNLTPLASLAARWHASTTVWCGSQLQCDRALDQALEKLALLARLCPTWALSPAPARLRDVGATTPSH